MTAATDCPPCPACRLPCGSRDFAVSTLGKVAAGVLMCPACGHAWEASPEDYAQAVAADAAYETQCAAEEEAAKAKAQAARDEKRMAELLAMKARGETT